MLAPGAIYVQQLLQSAAVATGNGTPLACTDLSKGAFAWLAIQVKGITTATITWEATINGADWVAVAVTNLNTGAAATTATADGVFRADVRGFAQFRARISAWTAGAITVTGVLGAV